MDWTGKTVLVIGGGPSVLNELRRLEIAGVQPDVVLSANEHGCKQGIFPVHWLVTVSEIHTRLFVSMESYLRRYDVPIMCRYHWANYRLRDWRFRGDSGMTAIAIAVKLNAARVIVTGVEGYKRGRQYFHGEQFIRPEDEGANQWKAQNLREWQLEYDNRTRIEVMSGFLTDVFPIWSDLHV